MIRASKNSARKSSRESARLACRNLFEHMLGRSRDDGKHFVVRADEELTPLSNWNQPSEGGPTQVYGGFESAAEHRGKSVRIR
jgi:hypothetical protein